MGTIDVGCNTKMMQLSFIDNRAYPGGPNAWFFAYYSDNINTTGNISYTIANFLADGLLVGIVRLREFIEYAAPSFGEDTSCGIRSGSSLSLLLYISRLLVSI